MKAAVIYESMYGNTRKIAQRIASGLSATLEVEVLSTADVAVQGVPQADLVVVGAPTHVHGMTRPRTRRAAVDAAADPDKHLHVDPSAQAPGVREWLGTLGSLDAWGACFDTRADGPAVLTGRASRGIAKQLERRGCPCWPFPRSSWSARRTCSCPAKKSEPRPGGVSWPTVDGWVVGPRAMNVRRRWAHGTIRDLRTARS